LPVLAYVTKQPMLDFVPLGCTRRKMTHMDFDADILRELTELIFPHFRSIAVASTAVAGDQQFCGAFERAFLNGFPPTENTFSREFRSVVACSNINKPDVVIEVVDAIR
jgi:hypothetical protein